MGSHPSDAKLLHLQALAAQSIGTRDAARQRGLVIEQGQLIKELVLMQEHLAELDEEIRTVVEQSREGQILISIPGVGHIPAAILIATIGHINNFPTASTLKSYLGWAPKITQTGITINRTSLSHRGARITKQAIFLIVGRAIQMDCEWAKIYERLVPIKCAYDERTRTYRGKKKVMGRLAGQMITMMYALLKQDQEVLRRTPPGQVPPSPILYDPNTPSQHLLDSAGSFGWFSPAFGDPLVALIRKLGVCPNAFRFPLGYCRKHPV